MYILRHYPFSQAYPLSSLAYVFGMVAAMWIFHEQVVARYTTDHGRMLLRSQLIK